MTRPRSIRDDLYVHAVACWDVTDARRPFAPGLLRQTTPGLGMHTPPSRRPARLAKAGLGVSVCGGVGRT